MAQISNLGNKGTITEHGLISSDVIAYWNFEETENFSIAIDNAMNFDAQVNEERTTAGKYGRALPVYKDKVNFSCNMVLDEIPATLKMTVDFYINLKKAIERGEHATYTLFSKQWASGMKWYSYIITRLETVQICACMSYLVPDENNFSLQIKGAEWDSIKANGLYYKKSDIVYEHSVNIGWKIVNESGKWNVVYEQEGVDAIVHFTSDSIDGEYTATAFGRGTAEVESVKEINDTITIDVPYIPADEWIRVQLPLALSSDLPSGYGLYFGNYSEIANTSEIIDIPINTDISPQLIGGDTANLFLCTSDLTIPYVVDGHPLPSSHRYGINGTLDEATIWASLQKPVPFAISPKLSVDIEGDGSVSIDPDKEEYSWNEEVALTAIPGDEETFILWLGDVKDENKTDNPLTIYMTSDKHLTAVFSGKCAKPTASIPSGNYTTPKTISLSTITDDATIYYTLDGSPPDDHSLKYTAPITITENTTLKAVTYKELTNPSDIATFTYTFTVATPVISPSSGSYSSGTNITIFCGTSGATIYYTTNGSDPTEASDVYSSAISLTSDMTVKAKAYKTNWIASGVATNSYTVQLNAWIQKASFVEERRQPLSFSVNGKGYVGFGNYGAPKLDLYEYNPMTDTWAKKADYPMSASPTVAFSIGGKGYVCCNGNTSAFYEYDPSTNTWTAKANFLGGKLYGGVGFSIGAKGYAGLGRDNSTGLEVADFYEYDPAENKWTQKADFGGGFRQGCAGFSIGSKGYVCCGLSGNNYSNALYEYNPSTNTWTLKASFIGNERAYTVAFVINNKAYVGLGKSTLSIYKDFYEYDPAENKWTQKADFGGGFRQGCAGFSIGSKGYAGCGEAGTSSYKDFWEYAP